MKIIKKALSGILAASLIISNISVNSLFAIGNTEQNLIEENNLTDNYGQLISLNDTEDEPSVDNWELGLVFYDSSVDNGKTALTTIDWDASDGDYREGVPRVITAQINYKNTSTVTTYNPGELEISIPNLIYNTSSSSGAQWKTEVIVGANDSTHDNYDWDFATDIKPTNNQSIYTFKNATTIEENSNFEGSIQIVYTITPNGDNELAGYQGSFEPEKYEDECVHTYNTKLQAILKDITESNEVSFNYSRIYTHPWKYKEYSVTKTADKISSYDGLGSNAQDYIWVKYTFKASGLYGTGYPQIHATNFKFVDHLPKDCIVYNSSAKQISNEVSIPFSVTGFMTTYSSYIFVGYPKAIYNESNMYTKNEVELRGRYVNKKEEEILDSSIIDINLADFEFSYSGNLYGIQKYSPITTEMHYQAIIDKGFATNWHISPTARYTGNSMTIKIGDDLLYATGENGNVERLNDNDYYFSSITWNGNYFKNGNGTKIAAEKYDVELWIKYKNSEEYTLSSSFKNPSSSKTWNFSKEISSWYFIINDMEESIIPDGSNNYLINTTTVFKTLKNIPQKGTLHNFDYIQVYFKDINNNLLLQNPQTLDNYSTFVTKQEIAVFDIEEYGVYIQRDTASRNWNYHNVSQITHSLHARKNSIQLPKM